MTGRGHEEDFWELVTFFLDLGAGYLNVFSLRNLMELPTHDLSAFPP